MEESLRMRDGKYFESLLFLSFNNIHPQMIWFTLLPFKHRYNEGACDHFMVENGKYTFD